MNTGEVKAFFRLLASEPDLTFFDATAEANACKRAHNRFRRIVVKYRPKFLEEFVDVTLSSAREIDLVGGTVKLFGASATHGPALKITEMVEVNSSGDIVREFRFVRSRKELLSSFDNVEPALMSGRKIQFGVDVTGTLRIFFVSVGKVVWTNAADFVDDFSDYHDLIAYFAYEEYAALDQAFPQPMLQKLMRMEKEFIEHLGEGVVLDVDQVSYEANW